MQTPNLCCLLLLCLVNPEGDGVGLAEEVLQALLAGSRTPSLGEKV